jgi:hypothetical protein
MNILFQSFTILQSNTGAVFLDAMLSARYGAEYGWLFKSNFDGTRYSLSLPNTNRNFQMLVDFEKVQGGGLAN